MKRNPENSEGEPGQFKTTPVAGFTPTAYTPTESPVSKKEETLKLNLTKIHSAEKKRLPSALRPHRKGVNK